MHVKGLVLWVGFGFVANPAAAWQLCLSAPIPSPPCCPLASFAAYIAPEVLQRKEYSGQAADGARGGTELVVLTTGGSAVRM